MGDVTHRRIIIYGNSGAGKTTLARELEQRFGLPRLDLDSIAWGPDWGQRRPLQESISELLDFVDAHDSWIIEGCYGDLIEAALPFCTELRFINPGVEVCVENCRARFARWEQQRRPEDERSSLEELLPWVRSYSLRNDEFSLARHCEIYDGFSGHKIKYTELPQLNPD